MPRNLGAAGAGALAGDCAVTGTGAVADGSAVIFAGHGLQTGRHHGAGFGDHVRARINLALLRGVHAADLELLTSTIVSGGSACTHLEPFRCKLPTVLARREDLHDVAMRLFRLIFKKKGA